MKIFKITLLIMVVAMGFGMTACKKKKGATKTEDTGVNPKQQGEVLINEYCSGEQFMSTKDAFRATATGESMDRETAKKKAKSNAMSELSKSISATLKVVGDNYVNSSEFNNKEEITETFQEMTRTVVDQNLKGAVEICEKLTQKPDGSYVSYVAIELSGERLANSYAEKLAANEKLKADYNYEKFKDTFNKEMEKMAAEQK
jgi:ribulose bisphosphate carboxylase small subunit